MEYINWKVYFNFSIDKGINEWKKIVKHILCECICKFDLRKCNSKQKWNNDKSQCECKKRIKHRACEENCAWNPSKCACKLRRDMRLVNT